MLQQPRSPVSCHRGFNCCCWMRHSHQHCAAEHRLCHCWGTALPEQEPAACTALASLYHQKQEKKKKKSAPAFQFPGSASHWQNLTRKQLARKSVRCSLQAPSHLVILRKFQEVGNTAESQMTGSQPRGFKGKVSN